MIRHVVIFEFEKEKAERQKLVEIKKALEALADKIPELIKIEVGLNMNSEEKQDLVLIADVANLNDLAVYANHPEHIKVGGMLRPMLLSRTCVDYES